MKHTNVSVRSGFMHVSEACVATPGCGLSVSSLHGAIICVCVSKASGLKLVLSLALLRGGRNLEEVGLTGHSSDHWA